MKDKLLSATGDELSRLLGEVLQPKKCFIERQTAKKHQRKLPGKYLCNTCGIWTDSPKKHKANPIALTPDNAFKWRDWAVKEYGLGTFLAVLDDLCGTEPTFPAYDVFPGIAQPKHYLIAAALCKLNAEEGK